MVTMKAEDIYSFYALTDSELKSVEVRLRGIHPFSKIVFNSQRLKSAYDAYVKATDKPSFRGNQ